MASTCDKCDKGFTARNKVKINCESCNSVFHAACAGLKKEQVEAIETIREIPGAAGWYCRVCEKVHKDLIGRLAAVEKETTRLRDELLDCKIELKNQDQRIKSLENGGVKGSGEVTATISENVSRSIDNKLDRKCRLVVRDLPESSEGSPDARKECDITRTAQALKIERDHIVTAFRAGKKKEDATRPRILIVRLRAGEIRDDVLLQGKKQQGLRVGPDLTTEERGADDEFFKRLEKLKEEHENEEVFRVRGPPGRRWLEDREGKRVKLPDLE